jgi:hypothetical protein
VARVLWLLPAVRWLCLFALVVSVFLTGLVTGVGLEATRHRVEETPAAVAAGYREGFEQGLTVGLGRRATHPGPQAGLPQE